MSDPYTKFEQELPGAPDALDKLEEAYGENPRDSGLILNRNFFRAAAESNIAAFDDTVIIPDSLSDAEALAVPLDEELNEELPLTVEHLIVGLSMYGDIIELLLPDNVTAQSLLYQISLTVEELRGAPIEDNAVEAAYQEVVSRDEYSWALNLDDEVHAEPAPDNFPDGLPLDHMVATGLNNPDEAAVNTEAPDPEASEFFIVLGDPEVSEPAPAEQPAEEAE